ncbi:hypothetical protein AFM12_16975 [Jiulongibacter sediminis]|uniref:TraB/GumN family protein n=2 Tax=Jiulongibacter sediminis TaxID=1605367 RepID=A0A0P7BII6_9BACT|nr:hypothetical protein AFM12_16975 [Jiulongibacter sediminis]TBX22273.1 hypothetical protein TK44_16985 [Jiulongibacter sediminis]
MKSFFAVFLIIIGVSSARGQSPEMNHIEVAILGTFHIGETSDFQDAGVDDILTRKRQREVRALVRKLAAFKLDKIFVENTPSAQGLWDKVYAEYQEGKLPTNGQILENEIFQFGIRIAKILNLQRGVFCINYDHSEGEQLYHNEAQKKWADFSKSISASKPGVSQHFRTDGLAKFTFQSMLQKHEQWKSLPLKEHLIQMNKESYLRELQYVNTLSWMDNNAAGIGAEITSREYYRNLKIIQNLISHLRSTDKRILIVYGAAHAKIFKNILESHPVFEVVDIEKILR